MHLSPHHHLLLTSYYFLFVCLSVLLFVCSFVHNSIDVNRLHLLNYHALALAVMRLFIFLQKTIKYFCNLSW